MPRGLGKRQLIIPVRASMRRPGVAVFQKNVILQEDMMGTN